MLLELYNVTYWVAKTAMVNTQGLPKGESKYLGSVQQ